MSSLTEISRDPLELRGFPAESSKDQLNLFTLDSLTGVDHISKGRR